MSTQISRDEVAHVARLARLKMSESELSQMQQELGAILEHASELANLDLSQVEPTSHALPIINVMRDDLPRPSLDRDEVLACAPSVEDHRFAVPRILGE